MYYIRHHLKHGFTLVIIILGIFVIRINDLQIARTGSHIYYNTSDLPHVQAVMILGASVRSDGTLSRVLQDRVNTAIEVYESGKADRILISADNATRHYDETRTIRNHLISRGIATGDIFQDFAGFDTYDSMYRARAIFQVDSLIIATQKFHQPRAVYLARELGIDASGIVADSRVYRDDLRNNLREMMARVKAWIDIKIGSSAKFGGETIPITGESNGGV